MPGDQTDRYSHQGRSRQPARTLRVLQSRVAKKGEGRFWQPRLVELASEHCRDSVVADSSLVGCTSYGSVDGSGALRHRPAGRTQRGSGPEGPSKACRHNGRCGVLSEFLRRGYEGLPGHRCRHPSPIYGGVFSIGQRATGLPESSRQRDRAWSRKTFCAYARRLLSTSQNPSINSAFGRRTESIVCAVRRS